MAGDVQRPRVDWDTETISDVGDTRSGIGASQPVRR